MDVKCDDRNALSFLSIMTREEIAVKWMGKKEIPAQSESVWSVLTSPFVTAPSSSMQGVSSSCHLELEVV